MTKSIQIEWNADDVLSINPNLTEQQVSDVLDALLHDHDSSIGINWGIIDTTIDIVTEGVN